MELVPWGNEHFDDLVRLAGDPRMTEYIGDGKPWSLAYATDRHRNALEHWEKHGYGWHAAIEDGRFVGLGAIMDRGEDGIELGWWVDPEHWGRGLATRIAEEIRDIAARQKRRVFAGYLDGNGASGRVMEKIGMPFERSFTNSNGRIEHLHVLQQA